MLTVIASLLISAAAPVAALAPSPSCFDAAVACAAAAEAPAPSPEPGRPSAPAGRKPLVISIVGVNFDEVGIGYVEVKYFKAIINYFFPGKQVSEDLFEEALAPIRAEFEQGPDLRGFPDEYLEKRLAEVLPTSRYEIVPLRWSRDPDDTAEALKHITAEIRRIGAEARETGRPVYLVAHSWGTVLAHSALHSLAASDPELRIDRYITLGSPLVPGYWWLKIFLWYQITADQLQKFVAKPANVAHWVNTWARNDYFSNEIKAADVNVREDDFTEDLALRVKAAVEADSSLKAAAKQDLSAINNFKIWHFAYINDFKVHLKTLKQDFERLIFGPLVSQELVY